MNIPKQINEDISLLNSLKNLCTSYEEISVMKMRRVRDLVLSTRDFYTKLSQVYYTVKTTYRKQVAELATKKRARNPNNITSVQKTIQNKRPFFLKFINTFEKMVEPPPSLASPEHKQEVALLLSSNTKLHGPIIRQVYNEFEEYIKSHNSDIIIVGRLGREMYEKDDDIKNNYLYFELPDSGVTLENLKSIIYHLIKYKKITVFYGQYETVVKQTPHHASITGDEPIIESEASQEQMLYLFEPRLEKIVEFFETQIFSALFKQTVHEGELARFASRINAMETALQRIEQQHKHFYTVKRKTERSVDNRRQLERISGIALWGGRL